MEPTNNAAERAIRHAVLLRKITFGTHSKLGSRFIERILTVHATLQRQGRDVRDFVEQACRAVLLSRPAPPLLLAPAATPLRRAA